ncbi:MAG: beta-lactamase family protein, partial [Hyphomicrobiaceae bacterium]|nr:beta-lactamase family protein [Hyphomicrobiaceae bacterium]
MTTEPAAPPLDASASDPQRLGWMQGFPPAPEVAVTFADGSFRQFPQSRWGFSHFRQLLPTKAVWRGAGPASVLPRDEQDLDGVPVPLADGRRITLAEAMAETYADGVAVLHKGRLVYERYFGALAPHLPHIAMSVTKSFVGTLAGMMVADGRLDPAAPVPAYVPELAGSGYADATVRQVMDMTTAIAYTEVYTDPA